LLNQAVAETQIIITNDRDFGELIYRERREHRGVVFLRLRDDRVPNKIRVIAELLAHHGDRIAGEFIVVTESQVRIGGEPSLDL
jgi:predicted nuclease of predicted toxin-antitoxin system